MGRINKTKEQIVKEVKNSQEIKRKRQIVTEQFFPALQAATISVDEAKSLVQAMGTLIMEETMRTMRERKFADITESMFNILCKDGQRKEEIQKLLETLKEENLFVAREIIEGMTQAIEMMIREEMQGRKLETLKADWARYLNE